MSEEELKQGKKEKHIKGQQAKAEPIEETQERKREELKLRRETAKLLRQLGNDWEKLGGALYTIYKEDKEKAFGLIQAISHDDKLRKGIKGPKLEDKELGKWLDWLDRNGLNLPLNSGKIAKTVLALATFSGLKKIESEDDVNKAFAITVLRKAARSDPFWKREAAAKLIGELGLQEDLKAELMLLMLDEWNDTKKAAEDAWKVRFGDVKAVYEEMKEEEKERVKELIREAVRSNDLWRREAAPKLIWKLGLQEGFLDKLIELADKNNMEVAKEALASWAKEKGKKLEEKKAKIKEGKARLANPFALAAKKELYEPVLLAMAVLCS